MVKLSGPSWIFVCAILAAGLTVAILVASLNSDDPVPDPDPGEPEVNHLALIKELGDCRQTAEYPEHDTTIYDCRFEAVEEEHILFAFGPNAGADAPEVCDPGAAAGAEDFPRARKPVLIGPDSREFCLLANVDLLFDSQDPRGLAALQKIIEALEAAEPRAEFGIWQ